MKKILLSILLACNLFAASASAGVFKVTDHGVAVGSIDIPEGWEPFDGDEGYRTYSKPNSSVAVKIKAVASDKGAKGILDDAEQNLKTLALNVSRTKQETFKVAGIDATEVRYKGNWEGSDGSFLIVLVPLKDKTVVMISWAEAGEKKAQSEAVLKMANSAKAL